VLSPCPQRGAVKMAISAAACTLGMAKVYTRLDVL
jgi:hypothetical protein